MVAVCVALLLTLAFPASFLCHLPLPFSRRVLAQPLASIPTRDTQDLPLSFSRPRGEMPAHPRNGIDREPLATSVLAAPYGITYPPPSLSGPWISGQKPPQRYVSAPPGRVLLLFCFVWHVFSRLTPLLLLPPPVQEVTSKTFFRAPRELSPSKAGPSSPERRSVTVVATPPLRDLNRSGKLAAAKDSKAKAKPAAAAPAVPAVASPEVPAGGPATLSASGKLPVLGG